MESYVVCIRYYGIIKLATTKKTMSVETIEAQKRRVMDHFQSFLLASLLVHCRLAPGLFTVRTGRVR